MDKEYVIDLSQRLVPGKEHNFKFEAHTYDTTRYMPQLTHDADIWYIMGQVDMCTHNGTHVEVPYHHLADGLDIADFPVHRLIGNLVLIDLSKYKPSDVVTMDEILKYDSEIKKGDIVFLRTGMDKNFRSDKWNDYPYLHLDCVRWFIEKGVSCLGTDAAGIEDANAHNQPAHVTLFKANVPLVESLTNLDRVESGKYMVFILPLPIEKMEASPVRVVAVAREGIGKLNK